MSHGSTTTQIQYRDVTLIDWNKSATFTWHFIYTWMIKMRWYGSIKVVKEEKGAPVKNDAVWYRKRTKTMGRGDGQSIKWPKRIIGQRGWRSFDWGIMYNSVVAVRSEPLHAAEMVTARCSVLL